MSIHVSMIVSGVVGWCLEAYSEVENTYFHHLHTFLHTGSDLYNPLQQSRIVPRPHILYNISTTLYSLQLYSISTVYNLYNTPLEWPIGWAAFTGREHGRGRRHVGGICYIVCLELVCGR